MRSSFRQLSLFLLGLSLVCAVPSGLAKKKASAADSSIREHQRALHALNRLTFGPRPGDMEQVLAMGADHWIDSQLHPEKIQDSTIEARLAPFRTLHMSTRQMVEEFPDRPMIRRVLDGKSGLPSDPAQRAIVQVQVARMQDKKEKKEKKEKEEKQERSVDVEAASAPAAEPTKVGENLAASDAADAASSAKTAEEISAAAAAIPDENPDANKPMSVSAPPAIAVESKSSVDDSKARRREDRLDSASLMQSLLDLPAEQRYKKILAMSADDQVSFADGLRGGRNREVLEGMDARQKETLLAMNNPQAVILDELVQAKLLRAIYSERQLEEVMTDFWFNHFNVFVNKGADRVLVTDYEQNVIRPHALGNFEDLLVATARSPAMLFYLDNWLSVGPNSMQALGVPERPARRLRYPGRNPNANEKRKRASGLNENYGRELLELHTLSVNGGYSQRDVTEVAKVFTGWTIEKPYEGGGFRFDPRLHEPGPKFVLGKTIKPGGEDEGREVLHRLATSPQTAHFISLKLALRFVSDDPPSALVDRMAKTFQKKKGDIREVLATLFHSPEFWAEGTYRAKVKTPFEFVVSAVRASGAEVDDATPLARQLNTMGMPLYGAQPPTGYSMSAKTWVSSSALLNRMNFALAFTAGKVKGVVVDAAQLAGGSGNDTSMILSALEAKLLGDAVSKQTHDSIVKQAEGAPQSMPKEQSLKAPDAGMIAGLLLGSPEFQKR